jgi:DNA-directed RNA polymerase subunit RPC12/RpoP
MDRRNPDSPSSTYVACRTCGMRLPFQPGQMRLTPTHAELRCAACGAEVRVRRSDAEREPEGSIAKAVSAATRLGIAPDEEPTSVPHLLWGRRLAPAYASPG